MKHKVIITACCAIILGLMYVPPIYRFELNNQLHLFKQQKEQRSITFIMGEDIPGKTYYQDAHEHFINHPTEHTHEVISSCRTLDCVIETINTFENDTTWGVINIVAHGNPQTGLNLYLSTDGHKATPKRMVQEVILASLPTIKSGNIDSLTKINVWSCGIGKSPLINFALPQIFKDENGNTPDVYCSPYFVLFKPDESGNMQRLNASYWPYYYKRGYRPSTSEIAANMRRQFPKSGNTWTTMLDSEEQVIDYHIPISYKKYFDDKDDRPDLSTPEYREAFINQEPAVQELIAQSGIAQDNFDWKVEKRYEVDEHGQAKYFVKVIGMSTVMCFLEVENS